MENRKCGECGGDVALRLQISDRDFYIENGEIKEDTNAWFETTFVAHCMEDFEHDITKGFSEQEMNEFYKWEEKLIEETEKKFDV